MADLAYPCVTTLAAEVYPVDPVTGRDIEDLGLGSLVEIWIPDSRREDVDRNDATRRELTAVIEAAIAGEEG
jgi:hypothetical protein